MSPRTGKTLIVLNIYDLIELNQYTSSIGIGAYHTGIEFGGEEYTFGSSGGIFSATPKQAEGAIFRESLELGVFEGSCSDARHVVHSMKEDFPPHAYNLITKNCNSFTNELAKELLGNPIPNYINRLAYWGSLISCLLPSELTRGASPDQASQSLLSDRLQSSGREKSSTPVRAFSGAGVALGGSPADLTDRREKMRLAAMQRLEKANAQES